MKINSAFLLLAMISAALSFPGIAAAEEYALAPHTESFAYKQYQLRPKSELSKLYYLMDRYNGSDFKVLYDGAEYDSGAALKYAKSYIAKHYRKQPARAWVTENAYRSGSGSAIYLKSPEGKTTLLRDALIEELKTIETVS